MLEKKHSNNSNLYTDCKLMVLLSKNEIVQNIMNVYNLNKFYLLSTELQLFVEQHFVFAPGIHELAHPAMMLSFACCVYKYIEMNTVIRIKTMMNVNHT